MEELGACARHFEGNRFDGVVGGKFEHGVDFHRCDVEEFLRQRRETNLRGSARIGAYLMEVASGEDDECNSNNDDREKKKKIRCVFDNFIEAN